jgi:hypothetical protein
MCVCVCVCVCDDLSDLKKCKINFKNHKHWTIEIKMKSITTKFQ